MRALTRPEGIDAVARVHVSGAEDAGSRGSRNQVLNWWRGLVPWIWEMVSGGLVPNWWARAAWERTWVSVVEVGVEVSELGGLVVPSGASPSGAMSPGATGVFC